MSQVFSKRFGGFDTLRLAISYVESLQSYFAFYQHCVVGELMDSFPSSLLMITTFSTKYMKPTLVQQFSKSR